MTTILPDNTGAYVLAIAWNNDCQAYQDLMSPVIAWEISPGEDPRPITLLDLEGLAWAVIDQTTGRGFMGDCCAHHEEIVQELRRRARLLAEVNA